MSVSFSFRQRATSEEWCASPPLSVILGAAAAEEDDGLEGVRARARRHVSVVGVEDEEGIRLYGEYD